MKALNLRRLCVLGVTGVLPMAFSFPVVAGEKIIVPEGKSQADPTKEVRSGSDLFKSPAKFEEPNLYDGLPVLPRFGPALSKKDQDRLKMKREAKENWLVNPQDDTQRREEEESTLGVKNNVLTDLNKGGKANWLEPKRDPNQRLPGQLRSLGGNSKQEQAEARQAAQEQRNREDAEEESKSRKTFDLNS